MGGVYLGLLLGSLFCILLIDRRFSLFFWKDWRSATLVTVAGSVFFLIWDAVGIGLGIFFRGDAAVATGVVLAPELPLEEPIFLVFLVVCTMVIYTGSARLVATLLRRRAET